MQNRLIKISFNEEPVSIKEENVININYISNQLSAQVKVDKVNETDFLLFFEAKVGAYCHLETQNKDLSGQYIFEELISEKIGKDYSIYEIKLKKA